MHNILHERCLEDNLKSYKRWIFTSADALVPVSWDDVPRRQGQQSTHTYLFGPLGVSPG